MAAVVTSPVEAAANLRLVVHAGVKAGPKAFDRLGAVLVGRIKQHLSKPGTGRVYRRRSVLHRASAPGEPPAVDTGKYRNSWGWTVVGEGAKAELWVGTGDKRGPWLEYGTSRMLPRPHLRPVIEAATASAEISSTIAEFITTFQEAAIGSRAA